MSVAPRFIMIGGFLGAGKTTMIAKLANQFRQAGKNVVIVTNDQAADLVDTLMLRSQGFQVGEVAGSCFCCNFNELTGTVEQLAAESRPDVILAEPVGSCTDLVATVIRPLEQLYEQPFEIAPFGVIIKPSHGFRILGRNDRRGFSPQAEYIFRKQLEEADFIMINRIDELPAEEAAEIAQLLETEFPTTPVLQVSAKTGAGFPEICDFLQRQDVTGQRLMEVDYDVYAEGEAELGWLNCQVKLSADSPFSLDDYLLQLLGEIKTNAVADDAEVAHLKVIGMADGKTAVANLVSNANDPVVSLAANWQGTAAELVINARIAMDPEILSQIVQAAVEHVADANAVTAKVDALQSFRPGRPVPTHRLNN
ncbi:GTP-binding protein [Planctomycetaceae bacterium SH139]